MTQEKLQTTQLQAPVTMLLKSSGINWMHTEAITFHGDGTATLVKSDRYHKWDEFQGPSAWQRLCRHAYIHHCNMYDTCGATFAKVVDGKMVNGRGEALDPAAWRMSNEAGFSTSTAYTVNDHVVVETDGRRLVARLV